MKIKLDLVFEWRSGLVALLALVLIVPIGLGYLAYETAQGAAAPQAASKPAPMRYYYLTYTPVSGNQALGACATNYHMASLWEIMDTSHLIYDELIGEVTYDSGEGPPSEIVGWVRTGTAGEEDTFVAGKDNCQLWASDHWEHYGSLASLNSYWNVDTAIPGWSTSVSRCDLSYRVWCVQDVAHATVYLPLVTK